MQNPEQHLIPELVQSLQGQKPTTQVYLQYLDPAGAMFTAGSENWRLDGEAVYYREQPDEGSRERLTKFFQCQRQTWMGSEENSTVYGEMHLLGVAGIHDAAAKRPGDAAIAAEALAWIGMWFGLAEACRDPVSGTCLTVGGRSGDRDPAGDQTWRGWLRALAAGEDEGVAACEKRAHDLGLGPNQSWIKAGALAVRGSLAAGWSARSTAGFGLASPIHVLTWPDHTRAVFMEESKNPNTPALLGAIVDYRTGQPVFSYLPPGGGARIRGDADQARCSREGQKLLYTTALCDLAPPDGRAEIELPPGEPQEVIFGAAPGQGLAPPQPTAPPDRPSETPDQAADRRQRLRQMRQDQS